jgi:DNA-binding transcriptional regulator YiaG
MGRAQQDLRLIGGPYYPPRARRGHKLFCEIRGTVTVGGYSDALIPWPRLKKGGNACLILCGDLVRAVKREALLVVAHHWGVSHTTVWNWRKALGVERSNEGTHQRLHDQAVTREDDRLDRARRNSKKPKALAKLSASLKGRVQSPATVEAVRRAAKRQKWTEARKRKIAALWRRRGHRARNPNHRPWTAAEDALLGTDWDAVVAGRLGRSLKSVHMRRFAKGIPSYIVKLDGRAIRLLRKVTELERRELAAQAGISTAAVWQIETGRIKGVATDKAIRLAAALGVALDALDAGPRHR